MHDLTILWLKGGVSTEIWNKHKEFFGMNAIGIGPQVVKRYTEQDHDISRISIKVQPFLSQVFKEQVLGDTNYMMQIMTELATYAD